MKELRFLDELVQRYPVLEPVKGDILKAYEIMRDCYEKGGKLMIAGNGGSCSDSEHIVGELMKGFVKRRPVSAELAQALKAADPQMGEKLAENLQGGLPAIALTGHGAWYTGRCSSWILNVSCSGTTIAVSLYPRIRPPSRPRSPITLSPFAFAVTAAYRTFFELPEVEIPRNTSPSFPYPSTCSA